MILLAREQLCPYKINPPLTPEFVKLKQTWQQTKETAFRAKEGEEIVPGFKGKYHD